MRKAPVLEDDDVKLVFEILNVSGFLIGRGKK